MSNRAKGFILVLMSAVLWGTGGISGQLAYASSDITTPWLLASRMLFAGVILTILAVIQRGKGIFDIFKCRRDAVIFIVYCIFGNWLVQYSYFEAIELSNAATSTLLQYLAPSIVIVAVALRNKSLPSKLEIICVAMALVGLFFISTHGDISTLAISPKALFWGLVSAGSLAVYNTLPVGLLKKYGTYNVVGLAMIIGGIATVIVFRPYADTYSISNSAMVFIAYVLVFGTTIPFAAFSLGVKIVGSTISSIAANIEPVTSAVISIVFLNMRVTYLDIAGFFLIIGATVLLTLFGKNTD